MSISPSITLPLELFFVSLPSFSPFGAALFFYPFGAADPAISSPHLSSVSSISGSINLITNIPNMQGQETNLLSLFSVCRSASKECHERSEEQSARIESLYVRIPRGILSVIPPHSQSSITLRYNLR